MSKSPGTELRTLCLQGRYCAAEPSPWLLLSPNLGWTVTEFQSKCNQEGGLYFVSRRLSFYQLTDEKPWWFGREHNTLSVQTTLPPQVCLCNRRDGGHCCLVCFSFVWVCVWKTPSLAILPCCCWPLQLVSLLSSHPALDGKRTQTGLTIILCLGTFQINYSSGILHIN